MSELDGLDGWARSKVLEARAKVDEQTALAVKVAREVELEAAKVRRIEAERELVAIDRETQVALADGAAKLALARTARIARVVEVAVLTAGAVLLAAVLRCA